MWVKAQSGTLLNLDNVTSVGIPNDDSGALVAVGNSGDRDNHFTLFLGDAEVCRELLSELAAHISINDRLLRIDDDGMLR